MSCCLCRYVARTAICLVVVVLVIAAAVVALVVTFAPPAVIDTAVATVAGGTYRCTFSSVSTASVSVWADPYTNVPYVRGYMTASATGATITATTENGAAAPGRVVVARRDFSSSATVVTADPTTDAGTIYQWLRNAGGAVQQVNVLLLSSANAVATAQTTVVQAPLSCSTS